MPHTILALGNSTFASHILDVLSPLGVAVIGNDGKRDVQAACRLEGVPIIIMDDDYLRIEQKAKRSAIYKAVRLSRKKIIVVSSRKSITAINESLEVHAVDYIIRPYNYREFFSRVRAIIENKVRISCIGGGTGLFQILLGLKKLPNVLLTSIVSMSDDGGSSGKLRSSFGILPPGDIRRSLVALSNAPQIMNELMQYRFERGGHFSGHNLGNLFLTALTEIKGSVLEAVKEISDILNVQGIVLPSTDTLTTLCARFEDGTVVKGESKIDLAEGRNPDLSINKVWHEPKSKCTPEAYASIIHSDYIIIGPGDLYTSVVTNFLVKNLKEAVRLTKAEKVYICNLMTKPGETSHYHALEHVKEIVKYIGGDFLNYVMISNTHLSSRAIKEYALKYQVPVEIRNLKDIEKITRAKIIVADVGHETELVRHDSHKIQLEMEKIFMNGNK